LEHTIPRIHQLRLRIFAGPNGSGKSTVINSITAKIVNGKPLYLGIYINADDIASAIRDNTFSFTKYELECSKKEILNFAASSGLISAITDLKQLGNTFRINNNGIHLLHDSYAERLAQIIARLMREKLLQAKKRFSFETVFSHESNLDIMAKAVEQGYKVYLYFVSTEDPIINKYRVALRVKKNGHNVPADRIESRYYRAMSLVKRAAGIAYQAFFFDNSIDNEPFRLVGHLNKYKMWEEIDESDVSDWFYKYCI
jgi:predicted ABC-type ATPase